MSKRLIFKELTPLEILPSWVAQEGEAKLFPIDFDLTFFPEYVEQGMVKTFTPVWQSGKVVGVLEVTGQESEHDQNRKRFLATLITQASLAIHQLEQRERRLERIRDRFNPYIDGAPIRRPEDFYGRSELLTKLLSSVHNNNFVVLGERRIGKTSLLYRLEHELKCIIRYSGYEFFPIYLSLQGIALENFYPSFINKIRQALGLSPSSIPLDYNYFAFCQDLDDIGSQLAKRFPGKEVIVLLLIDEVDEINKYPDLLKQQIRAIMIGSKILRVVMVGQKIELQTTNLTSPWYNFLIFEDIGPLNEDDARSLILSPVAGTYHFAPDAVDIIVGHSGLKPRSIQHLCAESIFCMFERIRGNPTDDSMIISSMDVEKAIQKNSTQSN